MIPVASVVSRLRTKADVPQQVKDTIAQDGTSYVVPLSTKPIVSGTDVVYLLHNTFTTGVPQYVYRNQTLPSNLASGNHIEYTIDYTYGELSFYQGSGTVIASTGLRPFAPWNTSSVIAYYDSSKYTDKLLSDYISYAVASVETSLQIGMFVSGVSGVAPWPTRPMTDGIDYYTTSPYQSTEKFIIAENVEILQELIAKKAALDLAIRERRLGAGGAVRLRDGDTEIDTSVNQKYFADFVRDLDKDYTNTVKWVMYNMFQGFNLKQIDEIAMNLNWNSSSLAQVYIDGYAPGY